MKNMVMLALGCLMLALCSCGGGGGTASVSTPTVKAFIKTSALTTSENIAGIQLTLTLPAGVAPYLQTDGKVDVAKTVVINTSDPASQTLPGVDNKTANLLIITGIHVSGFKDTDSITINLTVAPGSFPTAADFKLTSFEAVDLDGTPVKNITPTLTTTIQ